MSEKRISKAIQRDSWSATKYALRLAQLIEREELLTEIHGKNKSDWASALDRFKENKVAPPISTGGSGREAGGFDNGSTEETIPVVRHGADPENGRDRV